MRPRFVDPGSVYLVTRRCTQRQFLLRPDKLTNQGFIYCLAYAASLSDVRVHAFVVMSNHIHLVLSDPKADLPDFMHRFDLLFAKFMNCHRGRWENFWSNEPYSAVLLLDAQDQVSKIAYTLANPVSAGLVERPKLWPGEISLTNELDGGERLVKRPAKFFDRNGAMPETLRLRIERLPGFDDVRSEEYVRLIEDALNRRVKIAQKRLREEGRGFMGRRAVKQQDPFERPTSREPRQKLNPRLAAKDKWRRIEALLYNKERLRWYRRTRLDFISGERNLEWPPGTYLMRVFYGQRCAGPPIAA